MGFVCHWKLFLEKVLLVVRVGDGFCVSKEKWKLQAVFSKYLKIYCHKLLFIAKFVSLFKPYNKNFNVNLFHSISSPFPYCSGPLSQETMFMNNSSTSFKLKIYLFIDLKAVVSSIKIDDNQSDHKMLQNSFPHRLITLLDRDHPPVELEFVPASSFLNNNGQSPDQSFHPTSRTSCLLKMKDEGSEGEPKPRKRKETFCKSATIDRENYWNWMERCLGRW